MNGEVTAQKEDHFFEIRTVIARMKAGHEQIAPDRMKYLLFQGEEYLRTLGSPWRRINNVIIE